jgi:cytochrome c-type biogenesis protein CcmF
MHLFGNATLALALGVALWGVAAAVWGIARNDERFVASARRSVYCVAALSLIAFAVVEIAYLRNDFSFAVVAGNSSRTTPLYYKATAMWSSQAGSLLLWLTILSLQSAVAIRIAARRYQALAPVASAVLLGVCAFFTLLMVAWDSPFETHLPAPADGAGLQPLLRYPLMALHPVALYLGYAGFTIPFAFAVAALVSGRVDASWLRATRRFTLAAWAFLAAGLILGARWSYAELGWGGYWGWDPVENAALLPWLTGTALLHSSMVQEKRGMLKIWNVSLVMGTFALALTGTFLVRSGILSSIHAFGVSTLGFPFVVAIGATLLGSALLVWWRRQALASEHRLDSLVSREAIFLLNNLVLVALAFVIFWGTFFPLISEALTGDQVAVGPPWFERYVVPLGIVLVVLTGVGPLLAWRATSVVGLVGLLRLPAVCALLAVGVAIVLAGGVGEPTALVAVAVVALTLAALGGEFWRAARARRHAANEHWPAAMAGVISRNRRRYGGYTIHCGFVVLLLGVAVSSSFAQTTDRRLRPGQSVQLGDYTLTYREPRAAMAPEKLTLGALVDVRRDGEKVTTLRTARELYPAGGPTQTGIVARYFDGEATSEIGLDTGLQRDIWVATQPDLTPLRNAVDEAESRFADMPPEVQAVLIDAILKQWLRLKPPVTFRVYVRPGVTWMWIGAGIVALGTAIAAWPARRPKPAPTPHKRPAPAVAA